MKELRSKLDRAERAYRRRDIQAMTAAADEVLSSLNGVPGTEQALLRARALEMHGVVFKDRALPQEALQAFIAAESALVGYEQHRAFLARIQLSLLQLCADLGLESEVFRYLGLARTNAQGSKYQRVVENFVALLGDESDLGIYDDSIPWQDRVAECERQLELRSTGSRRKRWAIRNNRVLSIEDDADLRMRLGLMAKMHGLYVENGTDRQRRTSMTELADVALMWANEMDDPAAFLEITAAFLFLIDDEEFDLGPRLDEMREAAFRLGTAASSEPLRARGHFFAAIAARRNANRPEATHNLLRALVLIADAIQTAESSAIRRALVSELDQIRDFALILAIEDRESELAAELIESERPQVLATTATRRGPFAVPENVQQLLERTQAVVGNSAFVTVGGTSRLADAASSPHADEIRVALEDAIIATGGSDAYWWGAFVRLGRAHWAVRTPDGRLSCGTRRFEPDEYELVLGLAGELDGLTSGTAPARWTDPRAEEELMCAVGDILIPEPLVDVLLRPQPAISLVVAGNLLSAMPVAALGISKLARARLIERADVRIQAPALITALAHSRRRQTWAAHYPVLLACTDPTGDLQHSRLRGQHTLNVLSHRSTERSPQRWATRANFVRQMRSIQAGADGILFYSGHVSPGDGGIDAALILDGGAVTAGDWFGAYGEAPLSAPARVVLSACASSGASGSGGGEWFGLAAALLSAGAQQVIATAWPILDTPFTNRFEAALLRPLGRGDDPAQALARLQRQELDRWRQGVNWEDDGQPLPAIWGAFHCIGLRHVD